LQAGRAETCRLGAGCRLEGWVHSCRQKVEGRHLPAARVEGRGQEAVAAASVCVDRAVRHDHLAGRRAKA
jgi:hypothetical protein